MNLTTESGGNSTTDSYPKRTVVYKTTCAGLDITANVFGSVVEGTSTKKKKKKPAILWIHGGGLIFGTKAWLPKEQLDRYTLREDYIVVSIDHRLAPETKVPDIVQDVRDAWKWMTSSPTAASLGIDGDRIAVVGHSAGGYLALMVGTLQPKPRAVVSFYGYGDLTGPWVADPNKAFQPNLPPISRADALASVGTTEVATDRADFDPHGRPTFFFYCKQTGAWIEECCGVALTRANADWFAPYEPIRNMTSDYPPTLLVHGDKDNDVPVDCSLRVQQELTRHGVPVELIRNPDWPHLFDHVADDPTVQDCLDQMLVFIKKYL